MTTTTTTPTKERDRHSCDRHDNVRRARLLTGVGGASSRTRLFFYSFFLVILVHFTSQLSVVQGQFISHEDDLLRAHTHILDAENGAKLFEGHPDEADHFHGQVVLANDYFLVGARNVLYNVSLATLRQNQKYDWSSREEDIESCKFRGEDPENKCQNYIKVVLEEPPNLNQSLSSSSSSSKKFLICGTNSFKPICRTLAVTEQESGSYSFSEVTVGSGRVKCPGDPNHNSTAVYSHGRLFTATVADLSSREPYIFSDPVLTPKLNSLWLNDPSFVSSMAYGEKMFFFFRETAVENINCGKAVFSRVAQVCPFDRGGNNRVLQKTWTSFFKARLNCSIPGDFPFYFDEIQSVSDVGAGNVYVSTFNETSQMVYAIFSTPRNGLRGSAVCGFRMSDVLKSFEGNFKDQKDTFSQWLPIPRSNVPRPHPANFCSNDSTSIPDQTLNFIKTHQLMDQAVPSFGGTPVFMQSSFKHSITQVAVDWHVLAADYHYYDVLFLGTDEGKVLKTTNFGRGKNITPKLVEVLVTTPPSPVVGLKIYEDPVNKKKRLMIITKHSVTSVPLHRCPSAKTCSSCIALRDPYCSWFENKCTDSHQGLQSLESGRHSKCSPRMDPVTESSHERCQCVVTSTEKDNNIGTLSTSVGDRKTTPPTASITTWPTASEIQNNTIYDCIVYAGACLNGGDEASCAALLASSRRQIVLASFLSIITSLAVGVALGICFVRRKRIYKYGLSKIDSYRKQVGASKNYKDENLRKLENLYEAGPPSFSSSHRPIITPESRIKSGCCLDDYSDAAASRLTHIPSNSSSFSFISPIFSACETPSTPPTIAKQPLKLNIFNFIRDAAPAGVRPNLAPASGSEERQGSELPGEDPETDFPYIDGIQDRLETTSFQNHFDSSASTPVVDMTINPVAESVVLDPKPKNSFARQIKTNGFLSNSVTRVRSFLSPGGQLHI